MLLYNVLLILLAPLWVLALLVSARTRAGLRERCTALPASPAGTVWIHAASVGEVEAMGSVIAELLRGGVPLQVTTMTRTGRERAAARFPGLAVRLAPLDLRPLVRASLRRARVAALVLVETELWPNYLAEAARARVPCLIAGGRISDRSWSRYRRLRWLLRGPLGTVSRVLARGPLDAERFVALGAPACVTSVLGELKLDAPPAIPSAELRAALGAGPFWVAGSTHAGEEEAVLSAWAELRVERPELRLVLVPRHPERVPEARAAAARAGFPAALRSELGARTRTPGSAAAPAASPVVVVDTVGELAALYALADLVFVGGSLVPVGGHNLLEPVRCGRVVMCGPHLENQRTQAELLEPLGALERVADATELAARAGALWRDPAREARGLAARAQLGALGGAGREVLAAIQAACAVPGGGRAARA